ncbi:MAG: glycosyltransferase [Rhabdaerophilum sp.]
MPTHFHIVQRMAPGGIETVVLDLARMGPEIVIVSLEGTRESLVAHWPALAGLGRQLVGLGKPAGQAWLLVPALAALMRKRRAQAVVTHHIGPLLYGGLAARLAGIARRIHVEHDGWHYANDRRRRLARALEWLVAPKRVAVSHATAGQVAEAIGVVHQIVIANGVDLDRFQPGSARYARLRFGLPLEARLIGCIGRLETVKGQDVLIDALVRLPAEWHAVLAGQGSQAEALRARTEALGLAGRIHFLGHVEAPESLFPAFDLLALPSRAEGFPRVLIEAQAAGLPVIATKVGGVAEAVCPRTGYLVPPENPDALAECIRLVAEMPPVTSPRSFVDPRFSHREMAAQYRALLAA